MLRVCRQSVDTHSKVWPQPWTQHLIETLRCVEIRPDVGRFWRRCPLVRNTRPISGELGRLPPPISGRPRECVRAFCRLRVGSGPLALSGWSAVRVGEARSSVGSARGGARYVWPAALAAARGGRRAVPAGAPIRAWAGDGHAPGRGVPHAAVHELRPWAWPCRSGEPAWSRCA